MNISISEIVVILLIALLVIKPEQLPDLAYAIGRFVHGIRDFFAKIKKEMSSFIVSIESANEQKRNK